MAGRPRANSKAAAGVLLDIDNLLSPKSSASDWSTGPLSVDILLNDRNGLLKPNGRNKTAKKPRKDQFLVNDRRAATALDKDMTEVTLKSDSSSKFESDCIRSGLLRTQRKLLPARIKKGLSPDHVVEYRFPARPFLGGRTQDATKDDAQEKEQKHENTGNRKRFPIPGIHTQQVKLNTNNMAKHSPAEYFLAKYLCRPRSAPIIRIPTVHFQSENVKVYHGERHQTGPAEPSKELSVSSMRLSSEHSDDIECDDTPSPSERADSLEPLASDLPDFIIVDRGEDDIDELPPATRTGSAPSCLRSFQLDSVDKQAEAARKLVVRGKVLTASKESTEG
ncbi:hypothetical protein GUITHDRAFT_110196 [Guillardia theta CCMP2712]|uniref:Uncharacterized protein n=1 Tax=Guillardia theta (strain CCMP2712) TaxID=905079 RepID=L1J5E8_GUITC|nr:hypothetical protein GUITHDRAFT_110196 [Guillardia theta CCMP2712]EKX43741.1 hypothetical protein GUITHDRAFT_110196 [Guillardia theta CCMP2712]|eukprot:XP_005830721.1 hypothetical protein GUITHDRAFT_110196 [Guillardia theta CCMP2712]